MSARGVKRRGECGWEAPSAPAERIAPDGSRTTYHYDTCRRLTAVDHPGGTVTRYRYAGNDRLAEIESACAPRRFEHDALGRLITEHRGDAGAVVYRYDASGRVSESRTARVSLTRRFDTRGRIVQLTQTIDGVSLEVGLDFDAQGRLGELRIHDACVRYTWNARGRPAQVAVNGQEMACFEYLDAERLCRIRCANGIVEESHADPVDARPRSRRWARREQTIDRLDYTYDAVGRLESDGRRVYRYDERGWLVAARDLTSGNVFSYDYDPAGNRIDTASAAGPCDYRFNQAGELTEVRRRGDVVARFVYDPKGRLTLAETSEGIERYLYGPADELLAVTDQHGRLTRLLVRTPLGVLAEAANGVMRYVHHDERGTRLFVSDERGDVVARDALDPFGLPLRETAPPAMFGTRWWDPRVRLYCFGARWYDPSRGRFLTPDSYTGGPDDARIVNALGSSRAQELARECLLTRWIVQPHNLYTFCGNDPINAIDPNGHWAFGRVLLSLLGAIWTLPNTLFGLLIEITLPGRRSRPLDRLRGDRGTCQLGDAGIRRGRVRPAQRLRAGVPRRMAGIVFEPARYHVRQRVLRLRPLGRDRRNRCRRRRGARSVRRQPDAAASRRVVRARAAPHEPVRMVRAVLPPRPAAVRGLRVGRDPARLSRVGAGKRRARARRHLTC